MANEPPYNKPRIYEAMDPSANKYSVGVLMSTNLATKYPKKPWGTPITDIGLSKSDVELFPDYVLVDIEAVPKSSDLLWVFENLPSVTQTTEKYNDELERIVITKKRRVLIGTGVASVVPGRIVEIEPIENTGMEMEITTEIAGWNGTTPPAFPIAMKTRPKMVSYRFPDLLKAINIEYAWAFADSTTAAQSYSEDYVFVFDLIKPADGPYAGKRFRYLTDNPQYFVDLFQAVKLVTKYEHPSIVRAWYSASTKGNSTFAVAKELEIPPSIHGTIVIGQPKIAKAIGLSVTELPATPNFENVINSGKLIVDVDSSDAGLGLSYVDIIEVNMTGVYDATPSTLQRLDPSTLGAATPPVTTDTGTAVVLPPITGSDSSEAVIVGRRQTVEAVGTGTVVTSGNIELFFAGASIDGNPASVSVPVIAGDTPEAWIKKCIDVAITKPAITNNWVICGGLNNSLSPDEYSPTSGAIGLQAIYLEIEIPLGVTSTGTVPFIFTASDVVGSPLTTNIAVASSDSFTEVGPKIVAALTAVTAISSKYTITQGATSALKGFIYLEAKTIRENLAGVTFTTVGGRGISAAPTSVEYSESGGRRLTMVSKRNAPHDETVNIGIVANGTGITAAPVSRTLIIGQADEARPAILLGELLKPTAIVSSSNSVVSGVTTKNCFVTLRIYETVGSNLEALRLLYEQRTVSNSLGEYSFTILYPAPRDNNPFDVIVSRRGTHLTTRGSFVDIAPATPFAAINAALTTISGTTEPGAAIAGTVVTVCQEEELTVTAAITLTGNAILTFTSPLVTGSPLAVTVPVLSLDDSNAVALATRTALGATAAITAHFVISGATDKVRVRAKVATANDATLAMALADGTSVGVTASASANITRTLQTLAATADSAGVYSIIASPALFDTEVVSLTATDAGGTSSARTLTARATVPAAPSSVAFATSSGSVLVATIPAGKAAEVVLLHSGASVGSVASGTGSPENIAISPTLNYGQVVGIRTVDGTATSAYVLATAQGSPSTAAVANLVYQSLDGGARSLISGTFAETIQEEELTVELPTTITSNGNAKVVFTSIVVTGTPLTVTVPVLNLDTEDTVATKIRAALNLVSAITDHFTISGYANKVRVIRRALTSNDTTLKMELSNDTCTGITPLTSANSSLLVTISMNGAVLDSAVPVDATSRYFSFAINRSHEFGEIFAVTPNVTGGVDSFIERPLTLIPTPNVFIGPPVVKTETSLAGFRPAFGGVDATNLTGYQIQVGLYNATYSAGSSSFVQSKWIHGDGFGVNDSFELAMPWGRYRDSEQFIIGFPNGETAGGTFSKTDLGVSPGGYATVYNGATPQTPTGIGMNFTSRANVNLPALINTFTIQVINPNTGQKSDKVLWRRGLPATIIESAL